MGGLGVTNSKVLESCHRLDRLAPNSVHVCGFIWKWMWIHHRLKTIRPTITHGGILGGFMGSTIQKTGKCGQTVGPIVTQFCTYSADESGNGHRLNKLAPLDTKGSFLTWG